MYNLVREDDVSVPDNRAVLCSSEIINTTFSQALFSLLHFSGSKADIARVNSSVSGQQSSGMTNNQPLYMWQVCRGLAKQTELNDFLLDVSK